MASSTTIEEVAAANEAAVDVEQEEAAAADVVVTARRLRSIQGHQHWSGCTPGAAELTMLHHIHIRPPYDAMAVMMLLPSPETLTVSNDNLPRRVDVSWPNRLPG